MLVVVAYDVAITVGDGTKRLNHAAKICLKYGQRVQNSVYECNIDTLNYAKLREELKVVVDLDHDSLRFYDLGKNYKNKIIHEGVKEVPDMQGTLIL